MTFGNLKSEQGLNNLDNHLASRSYVEGFEPSQADARVFDALDAPPTKLFVHALRWYNHIESYGSAARKAFPGSADVARPAAAQDDDDDDVDLFGSDDDDDAEAEKLREERLKAYQEKKSKKPALVAKSSVILDVKPWDDETDMKLMEEKARSIVCDGLVWGASKLVPVGYGIHKLQIMCVVEDEKVSIDWLTEEIQAFEDVVQSVDIAAFNKI